LFPSIQLGEMLGSFRADILEIGGHPAAILRHHDAVVQRLSQLPFMRDIERWGVPIIGTDLGNVRFANLPPAGGNRFACPESHGGRLGETTARTRSAR
jgi:hypothetical protein